MSFYHFHIDHDLSDRSLLLYIAETQITLMADLTKLTQAVEANTAATTAAVAALQAPSTDQPAIDTLQTQIEANTASLASATPAPAQP